MWFEGRNLKPYAEPVLTSDLKEGTVYFALSYADEEMLIPSMEAVVFVGRNLEKGDIEQVYFQDIDSYREGIRYDSTEGHANFDSFMESEMSHIFEYENALELLMACSLRRRQVAQS